MATVSKSKIKRMKLEWKIRHLLDELGRDERDLVSAAIAPLSALGEVRALAHLWYLTAGGVFDEELDRPRSRPSARLSGNTASSNSRGC
jgi:hypothetical protein